jgi:hypothetical protein
MKAGDYVRTKYGIAKYIKDLVTKQAIFFVIDKPIVYDNVEGSKDLLCNNEIIKSSPNIIDLIEVGDYVNGQLVTSAEEVVKNDDRYIGFGNYDYYLSKNEEIKSIVTKEQFKQIEYKIGDSDV